MPQRRQRCADESADRESPAHALGRSPRLAPQCRAGRPRRRLACAARRASRGRVVAAGEAEPQQRERRAARVRTVPEARGHDWRIQRKASLLQPVGEADRRLDDACVRASAGLRRIAKGS